MAVSIYMPLKGRNNNYFVMDWRTGCWVDDEKRSMVA